MGGTFGHLISSWNGLVVQQPF